MSVEAPNRTSRLIAAVAALFVLEALTAVVRFVSSTGEGRMALQPGLLFSAAYVLIAVGLLRRSRVAWTASLLAVIAQTGMAIAFGVNVLPKPVAVTIALSSQPTSVPRPVALAILLIIGVALPLIQASILLLSDVRRAFDHMPDNGIEQSAKR